MRRVVVTGMGIVSSIGNTTQEVLASLHEAKSGISHAARYEEIGFRCQVHGEPSLDPSTLVDRRAMRFHATGTAWNHVAMDQAIRDAGLEEREIQHERTGIIMGSGGPSARVIVEAADTARTKGPKRIGPFAVPKAMSSTASATLATWFKIKGVNYSISSACATSNHCIGNAYEMIQYGKQDVMFAGGCEELDWTLSVLFDAMGAMSTKFNDRPTVASRAYDANRDGFVIAGGAGVVVLEELEHARARGAKIYGEIVGYGATSDGYDMVAPSGEGAVRCMRQALATVKGPIDYINPHATSNHCIGNAAETIQWGKQDMVFAGGCEELDWTLSVLFDAMGAMSSNFNATPTKASRAYDRDRDGFVIAGGAAVLVLEELEHAKARGAKIYAEITGYAANSDGHDMVAPSGEGAVRCMKLAMKGLNRKVDYLNPHGTATPVGDAKEMEAVREVFGEEAPLISSTKSLSGHSLGAAGAQEAVYSLLMLNNDFVCESANIENLDPAFEGLPIVRKRVDRKLDTVMSNSFGFGGTNGCVIMSRLED